MPSATPQLQTARLVLSPLKPADAHEMIEVLAEPVLYEFTGGRPPSLEELEARYRAQVAGPLAGDQVWHNWILRLIPSQIAIGFVQATMIGNASDVAWLIGTRWQGQGYATEAVIEMCRWLTSNGAERLTAHIHPDHLASERVAAAAGLQPTDEIDDEGEVVWATPPT